MSQTSFLESVVTWDEKLCQQNVLEAVPKLFSHLQETVILQEEIGILKIICVSFLPWVQIEEAEQLLFADISATSCSMLDRILDEIKTLSKQTAVLDDIQVLLEILIELLDCYTMCIKYAQGTGSTVDLANIHSLPQGAVHLLKETYLHCKDSSDVYGDVLASVTEPLSILFKKAHALQLAFLGLLDNITVSSRISQQDVLDLCYVCQGLFEICQVVSSLDVKLVVSLWKAVSRLSGRHKHLLKDGLDVDTMVTYLCTEICKGYEYLLQLTPPSEEDCQELSLSQGDSVAFQKSLKVLGYQFRVIISLLDSFIDCVSDSVKSACHMVLAICRSLPPSIHSMNISATCVDEIRRHLVNGIEPLINLLVQNRTFVSYVMSKDDYKTEDRLAVLELVLKIADCMPKQTDDVLQKWMSFICENTNTTNNIFEHIFTAVSKCYVEMCLPLTVKTLKEVLLYEYICTHVCGLVGSIPAKYFGILEESLLKHLFSVNVYVSTLAVDMWCFMARFGSAELCYQHTKLLVDMCEVTAFPYNIVKLVKRLVKFLAPDHQHKLLKTYPPGNNTRLWCEVFVPVLSSTIAVDDWTVLVQKTTADVQNFVCSRNKTYADLLQLTQSLTYLTQLLHHHGNTLNDRQNPHSDVRDAVSQLLIQWDEEWTGDIIFNNCLTHVIELSELLIPQFRNEDFLKVFDLVLGCDKDRACVKIAMCHFLQACKKVKFSPDAKQPTVLKKIAMLYSKLLQETNALVHHTALGSFTQFAENTPYETLVPECLGDNQILQNKVVAFLSKTAEVHPDFDEASYLEQQYETVCQQQQQCAINNRMSVDQKLGTSNELTVVETPKLGTSNEPTVVETPAAGDMLDDIEEPALKRKRFHNNEEDTCDIQSVISGLEQNVSQLEQAMKIGTISAPHRHRLKTASAKLTSLIDNTAS